MVDATSDARTSRPLRLGMVGGGRGAFIGAVHRLCARTDGQFELVAGALSSDAQRARDSGGDLGLAPDRVYTSFAQMAAAEAKRADGIEVVSIVTPNDSHHAIARAFLDRGIDVICDKPMTTTVQDALDLVQVVRKSGLVFGLTHNYSGYPLVRQAREMVATGELGAIRVVQVEYVQDWLSTKLEDTGHKQAGWRVDPARAARIPAGHPEGYLEGFANLYRDLAEQIRARRGKRAPDPQALLVPTVDDGARGVKFIAAAVESHAKNGAWVDARVTV